MATAVTFPAGDLEKFVLSSNRKKLLQIEDDDTKHDPDSPTPILSSLYGSNEHTKYHLQHIENNITSILIKYKDANGGLDSISNDDTNAIKSLLQEATTVLDQTKQNKMKSNDIDVLNFRHKLRTLFLSPYVQMDTQQDPDSDEHDIYDLLIEKLGVDFNYSKPSDVGVSVDDENEQKISNTLDTLDVNAEIKQRFDQCKNEGDITQRFNTSAIPSVLEQDFSQCPKAIEDLSSYSKHVLSITNKTELAITWVKQNPSVLFEHICDQFSFTQHQLHALGDSLPKLWSNKQFLCLLMTKSLPTSVSFYLSRFRDQSQQTFEDFLPRELAMNCYDILLQFAMKNERAKLSPICKASVLFHWMQFRLTHYKEYDFEVFMEYLRIPKKTEYNAETRHAIVTRYIKEKQSTSQNDDDGDKDTKPSEEEAYQEDETYKHAFDMLCGGDCVIELFDGTWTMRYNASEEYLLMHKYALHYMDTNQWNTAMQSASNAKRINSDWFTEWTENNQTRSIEDALMEFMDERYLKIIRLQHLLWNGDRTKKPSEYMDDLKALCEAAPIITKHGKATVQEMQNEIIFDFDKTKNKHKYSLKEDEINLALNVKNLFKDGSKEILVQIFEMNTLSYYRDKRTEFDITMNLDGLNSKYLHSIPIVGDDEPYVYLNPFEIRTYTVSFPRELLHKRGVYIIDCIFSGYQTRAMIKIGDIKYIERITSAGHCFSFFDEDNQMIAARDTACNIFMDGHVYKPKLENSNKIFIPFSTSDNPPNNQPIIIQREDDPHFNVLSHFQHSSEEYKFMGNVYLDREQLLDKQRVQLLIRSALYIRNTHNGTKCQIPLTLVQDVKAEVNITTADDVDVDKTFGDLQLTNDKETVVSFTVPTKTRRITVTLTGFIKRIHSTQVGDAGKQFVSIDKAFTINDIENSNQFGSFHLNSCSNGDYVVSLLGKNGESIPNIVCDLTLTHHYFKDAFQYVLKTDKNGRIYLPDLCKNNHHQFKGLVISAKHENAQRMIHRNEWRLNECYQEHHNEVNDAYYMTENSTIHVALHGNIDTKRTDYALFDSFYAARYDEDCVCLTDDGYLQIHDLKHGQYVLKSLNADVPDITIVVSPASQRDGDQDADTTEEGHDDAQEAKEADIASTGRKPPKKKSVLSLYNQYFMQLSPAKPLQISRISGSRSDGFRVQLNGVSSCTRVHAILTHFYPRFSVLQYLQTMDYPSLMNGYFDGIQDACQYTNKRRISEEYRYCLDRNKYKKFYGNSLTTPSFLMKPLERGATTTGIQHAAEAEAMCAFNTSSGALFKPKCKKSKRKRKAKARIMYQPDFDPSNLDFLKIPSKVMTNVNVNDDGIVMINGIDPSYNTLHIIAVDEVDTRYKSYSFYDDSQHKYRDNRQPITDQSIEDIDKVILKQENRSIVLLDKGEQHVVEDCKSCEIQTYDTMEDIYSLLTALSKDNGLESTLNKWSFITQWNTLDQKQKLLKYDEFFCHELNFFLFVKDPVFFQKIARPWIAAKLRKDVMDYFLLNDVDHLRAYHTQPHLFERLNPLEKILLAHALKDELLRTKTLQYFENQQKLLRVSPQKLDKLFRTALAEKQLAQSAFKDEPYVDGGGDKNRFAWGGGGGGDKGGFAWGVGGGEGYYGSAVLHDQSEQFAGLVTQVERSIQRGDQLENTVERSSDLSASAKMFYRASKKQSSSLFGALRGGKSLKKKAKKQKMRGPPRDKAYSPTIEDCYEIEEERCAVEMMDMEEEEEDMFVMRDKMVQPQLYQEIESTKAYQETYWYQLKYEQDTTGLIPLTKFWCDYAQHLLSDKDHTDDDLTFLSKWILLATSNIHDIVCALAVLNLSFQNNGGSMVFVKQLVMEKDEEKQKQETISVHVSYFDPLDACEYGDDGERYDKFISPTVGTFYTLKVYRCVIVLTNVSSVEQNLKLLVEIPSGSIPCGKDSSYFNKTHFITIPSYSTDKLDFHFYFPEFDDKDDANRFYSFPIIVSKHRNNKIVSWTKAQPLNVVSSVRKHEESLHEEDSSTSVWNRWQKVSVCGDYDQILTFLSSQCNVCQMEDRLERIYYLFERKDSLLFWQNVVQLLWNKKLFCDEVIWSFALQYKTNDQINLKSLFEYLSTKQWFVDTYLSPYFYISNDLCIKYDKLPYFEYIPLINSRIHALGSTSKQIMNYNLRSQYESFLRILSYQSSDPFTYFDGNSGGQIILSLIYYLILQDRIDDALLFYKHFVDKYNGKTAQNNANLDYLKCYLLLFDDENETEHIQTITSISNQYLSSSLPKAKLQWFHDLNQLLSGDTEETKQDSGDDDLESGVSLMKSKQCSLSFRIDKAKKQLIIESNLVKKCNINFYGMNTELLFSIDPFTFAAGDKEKRKNVFDYISPGVSLADVALEDGNAALIDIPLALMNQNTFIVVESCEDADAVNAVSHSDTFYDHQLMTQIKETYGQIKVLCKTDHKPIKKAYIKVFAKGENDKNEFYKDGYTDLRGGFDYVSVSSGQLQNAQQFAILIVTKDYGCAVKYAKKPKT